MNVSVNLTIHNKAFLLERVLDGIFNNISGSFELITVFDNCNDNSERVFYEYIEKRKPNKLLTKHFELAFFEDQFETKSNNRAIKRSSENFILIIQDDCIIKEKDFDIKLLTPFLMWSDVGGVTGNTSHNWVVNENSEDFNVVGGKYLMDRWATTLTHLDHANKDTVKKGEFQIRQCVNRSPVMFRKSDLVKLNYFDESFVQDCDDHDLCFRMNKELGKVVGCVPIYFESDPVWGGTRENGKTKPWLFELYHKNSITLARRHKEAMLKRTIENRKIF